VTARRGAIRPACAHTNRSVLNTEPAAAAAAAIPSQFAAVDAFVHRQAPLATGRSRHNTSFVVVVVVYIASSARHRRRHACEFSSSCALKLSCAGMLLLFETPAGYSLFKVKDEKKLDDAEVCVCVVRA
jgi:hypothetical protein